MGVQDRLNGKCSIYFLRRQVFNVINHVFRQMALSPSCMMHAQIHFGERPCPFYRMSLSTLATSLTLTCGPSRFCSWNLGPAFQGRGPTFQGRNLDINMIQQRNQMDQIYGSAQLGSTKRRDRARGGKTHPRAAWKHRALARRLGLTQWSHQKKVWAQNMNPKRQLWVLRLVSILIPTTR